MVLLPIETPVSNSRSVLVLSTRGEPIVGAEILQNWYDYDAEIDIEHIAIEISDENGRVFFPARVTRRSLLYRSFVSILKRFLYGIHAGKGVAMRVRIEKRGVIGTNKVSKHPDDYVIIQGDPENFGKIDFDDQYKKNKTP